jgi:shikimate dehydrogenase
MRHFGLIGQKLAHSYSPAIHNLIGDYEYRLYPLEPENLANFVKATDLDGFNVTIPYKQDVIPLCRRLSHRAASIGSVNTMVRLPDGGFLGDNTDYAGFRYLLGTEIEHLKACKALVLGSGGAARTVCAVLADLGIPYAVISRKGENNYANLARHRDAALIVNATPVGMYPNNGLAPVDLRAFPDCRLVLDLIYNPERTALLLQSEDLGIPARNGLPMLAAQAVKAGELFLDQALPVELVDRIVDSISCRMRNIVLIGMPGSGKSSVAMHLANLTGRRMIDTDERIATREGMNIPDIFSTHGEAYFRRVETEVLKETAKQSGIIISTGGGIVTVSENRNLIRQNSVCLLLERETDQLEVGDRPLSKSVGNAELLRIRTPLYDAWSDRKYRNEDCLQTALQIKKDFKL